MANAGTSVGERIAGWLAIRNISQAELARRVGVQPPSVSDWLSGRTAPRQEHLEAIAGALGVSLAVFYGEVR